MPPTTTDTLLRIKLRSVYLDRDRMEIHALRAHLPEAEIQIPENRGMDTQLRRQIASRGLLRQWLSEEHPELRTEPKAWRIHRARGAKPRVTLEGPPLFEFNASHSDGAALFALAPPGVAVGVDLERIREGASQPTGSLDSWIARIGSETERKIWSTLSREQKSAAFSRLWVAKEAVLKALGTGFTFSPQFLTVPMVDGADPWVETPEGRLRVTSFDVGSRYRGALAVRDLRPLDLEASGELPIYVGDASPDPATLLRFTPLRVTPQS